MWLKCAENAAKPTLDIHPTLSSRSYYGKCLPHVNVGKLFYEVYIFNGKN